MVNIIFKSIIYYFSGKSPGSNCTCFLLLFSYHNLRLWINVGDITFSDDLDLAWSRGYKKWPRDLPRP